MSHPILYKPTEDDFSHNGIGILGECISCEVTEERNGEFELVLKYPVSGLHFGGLVTRAIIKAKPDPYRDPQLFRIYAISKPMSGAVTVAAEHISYDLSGVPIVPFSADSAASALAGLYYSSATYRDFLFSTDITSTAHFEVNAPTSARSLLGGVEGSILDVYGGEYEFDNFNVILHKSRGYDRGVSIRYGKNLLDLRQEENCASLYTGIFPYWYDEENGTLVMLDDRIVNAEGTFDFRKIKVVDFTLDFEEEPTQDELREAAKSYISANKIGVPSVSLTVSFAQLEQYDEYKGKNILERVSLCDTVAVEFPALGVSTTAQAVKVVYDVLANRVKSVTLGGTKTTIADTIASQAKSLNSTSEIVTYIKQYGGSVNVTTEDEDTGVELETKINKSKWTAVCTKDGEVVSGLYFDFVNGRFVFDGKIMAKLGEIAGWNILPNVEQYFTALGSSYKGAVLQGTTDESDTVHDTVTLSPIGVTVLQQDDTTQEATTRNATWWQILAAVGN